MWSLGEGLIAGCWRGCIALCWISAIAHAQTITPDDTAGTTVELSGTTYAITGGATAGDSLLHSFDRFALDTGFTGDFQNPGGAIANIIGRVTGGAASSIDGTLRAFANLYLINPAGMVFGPNATLDVNGSFYASTADRVVFADDGYFSVTDLAGSTFSMASPVKFGFVGSHPAAITVDQSVLEVPTGERLALVGGDLAIEGGADGFIGAIDGRIDLVSVASAGDYELAAPDGSLEDVDTLGTVSLSNAASIDVSGDGGGRIVIRGGEVHIEQSSLIANSFGDTDGGLIVVEGRDTVVIDNNSEVLASPFLSGIPDGVRLGGANIAIGGGSVIDVSGDGGSRIEINGGELTVGQAGLVAETLGFTSDGGIGIALAGDATFGPGALVSAINASDFATPRGIVVDAASITLVGDAQLVTSTFGSQPGGGITINAADTFAIDNPPSFDFGLFSEAFSTGVPGDINITAETVSMAGGQVSAFGGGDVTIDADHVNLLAGAFVVGRNVNVGASDFLLGGTDPFNEASAIQASQNIVIEAATSITLDGLLGPGPARPFINADADAVLVGETDAGTVRLNAPTINVDHGDVSVTTNSASAAGSIDLNAENVLVTNGRIDSTTRGTGLGGSVNVSADSVTIRGPIQSFISSSTAGFADAGSVNLDVGSLSLEAGGNIFSIAFRESLGSGSAGTININASERVVMTGMNDSGRNASGVSVDAFSGPSGSINITTPELILLDRGTIGASNAAGAGGDINLDVGRLELGTDSQINAFTRGAGDAGRISINLGRLEMGTGGTINATTEGAGAGGRVLINATSEVSISGESTGIGAETFGAGSGGEVDLRSPILNISGGFIISLSESGGDAGRVRILTDQLNVTNGGKIDASTRRGGLGGAVEVTVTGDALISGTLENGSPSSIRSNALGAGPGGSVALSATNVTISSGGSIESFSIGTGDAGDMFVIASNNFTMDDGDIRTQATQADGGNVVLQVKNIARVIDSRITSSVGTGDGGGGNIFVDPVFLILDGTQIRANAFGGPGGNILMVAENFLASPDSTIEASSELGIDGDIMIDAPDTDVAGALAVLPADLANAALQIAEQCSARGRRTLASFVASGRGGMPVPPGGPLPTSYRAGAAAAPQENTGTSETIAFKAHARRMTEPGHGDAIVSGTMVLSCGS